MTALAPLRRRLPLTGWRFGNDFRRVSLIVFLSKLVIRPTTVAIIGNIENLPAIGTVGHAKQRPNERAARNEVGHDEWIGLVLFPNEYMALSSWDKPRPYGKAAKLLLNDYPHVQNRRERILAEGTVSAYVKMD